MASNNNDFNRGYGNSQMPQYQNPAYPRQPTMTPQQNHMYNQQQQYRTPNQYLPPVQGGHVPPMYSQNPYFPEYQGLSQQIQDQYQVSSHQIQDQYRVTPQSFQEQLQERIQDQYQQAHGQYQQHQQQQQQYQQFYIQQQQQYQQQMNQLGYESNRSMASLLQSNQLDGTSSEGIPRPERNSVSHPAPAPPSQPRPASYQSNHVPLAYDMSMRQQQQQPQRTVPRSDIRPSSSSTPRQPSATRPPPSSAPRQPSDMRQPPDMRPPSSSTPRQQPDMRPPTSSTPGRPSSAPRPSDIRPSSSSTTRQPSSAPRPSDMKPPPSSTPTQPSRAARPSSSIPRQPPTPTRPHTTVAHPGVRQAEIPPARPEPTIAHPAALQVEPSMSAAATVKQEQQAPMRDDYLVLLLALADEYISKAHGMTTLLVQTMQDADVEQYHKLIASGLGCMEAVLRNFKFPDPRIEARLVQRFTMLLFNETENEELAHEFLSRTVRLCERHRLIDLRYSLVHVQLRFHQKSRPGAASSMVEGLLGLIEKDTCWVYATRFLRVAWALQSSPLEISVALQHLKAISQLASAKHHVPILATSSTLEALVHLRTNGPDAVQSAQRAIADARKHQFDPSLQGIPQMTALLDCLDLCCALVQFTAAQAMEKMRQMQVVMDKLHENSTLWRADGSFCIPVGEMVPEGQDICADSGGIFERGADGQRVLVFGWLKKSELFSLGYLLSGMTTAHRIGDKTSELYLKQGAEMCSGMGKVDEESTEQSLHNASLRAEYKAYLHQSMLLNLVLIRCNRGEWYAAKEALQPFTQNLSAHSRQDSTDPLELLTIYLGGLIKQGTGDLVGALAQFQCPALTYRAPGPPKPFATKTASQDLQLLAALNTILILGSDASQTPLVQTLLAQVATACQTHPDESFLAAYNIALVTSTSVLSITNRKNLLTTTINLGTRLANDQIRCWAITLMNETFFRGIVGEKVKNAAKGGLTLAKRCASPLWVAVAAKLLEGTCEVNGMKEEAEQAVGEARKAMAMLPEPIRAAYQGRA